MEDTSPIPENNIVIPETLLDKIIHFFTIKIAKFLVKISWITPNQISWLSGIVGSLVAGWYIIQQNYWLAVSFIILSGILDSVDGNLARERGIASSEGGILDSVIDRYVDFILISALILVAPETNLIVGLIALLGTTLVPYIRARSEAEGKNTVASIGSRATRIVLIIIGLLTNQIYILLITLAVISNIAAIHRFIFAIQKD